MVDQSYFHAFVLSILGYGMYTTIFLVALHLTLSRGIDRPRVGSAVLITIIWTLVTVRTGLNWALFDEFAIIHPDGVFFHGFPWFLVAEIVGFITSFLGVLLADGIMIWRCWVLCGQRWLVISIPALSFILSIFAFSYYCSDITRGPDWEFIFYATTVVINVFCLIAIVYRIVSVAGFVKSFKTYYGLLEILIESSVLYTATYIVLIGMEAYSTYGTEGLDERYRYVRALADIFTGVAPTLVIARVAAGHARPNDSWTRTSLPHIRTDMQSTAESMRFAQPVTTTGTGFDLEGSSRPRNVSDA